MLFFAGKRRLARLQLGLVLFLLISSLLPADGLSRSGRLAANLGAALHPQSAEARIADVPNFGSAVPCLSAPDQFATTTTADTIFNRPASLDDLAAAPALVTFGKTSKAPRLSLGQIGATYGLAYDDGARSGLRRLFIGAAAQRFAAYGPGGSGAIYSYDLDSGAVAIFARLTNVDRHGPRTNFDREIAPWVGKSGLGDLELHPAGDVLYAMNLHTRAVERLSILPQAPALAPLTLNFAVISADPAVQADLRPFGLEFVPGVDGKLLYVGVVDSAERPGAPEPRAYLLAVDTTRPTDQYVALTVDLQGIAGAGRFVNSASWKGLPAWYRWSFAATKWGNPVRRPQPILSDIEFAPDGQTMLLGLRDRSGDQFWSLNPPGNDNHVVVSQGDTLVYRLQNGAWTLQTAAGPVASDYLNDDYVGSQSPPNHSENHGGAMAWALGSAAGQQQDEVVVSSITPLQGSTGGATWYQLNPYRRERMADAAGRPIAQELIPRGHPAQGKAQRLGDLENLCAWALIGDYVWRDGDRDGLQDTGEPPLAGVTLELLDGESVVATATTDALGHYRFAVRPGRPYSIRPAASNPVLDGLVPSGFNQGVDDNRDSDLNPASQRIAVPPQARNAYNLAFDAGYAPNIPPACPPGSADCPLATTYALIGDLVWNDLNGNGIQESGEPPLAGVTVELIDSGDSSKIIQTTRTDASGKYSFSVLPADAPIYRVQLALDHGDNAALLARFQRSPRQRGGHVAQDSDGDSVGQSASLAAPRDSLNLTVDFGLYRPTNVRIRKAGPEITQPGASLTYDLIASNTTNQPAAQVVVTDILPSQMVIIAALPEAARIMPALDWYNRPSSALVWNLGTLAPGAQQSLRVVVASGHAQPGTILRNIAQIATASPGDDPGDNTSIADTRMSELLVDLSLSKTGPSEVARGEVFTYTLRYRNNGPDAAPLAQIEDTLPPFFQLLGTTPPATYSNGQKLVWNHRHSGSTTLSPGQSGEILVSGRFVSAGSWTNSAQIQTVLRELTLSNNRAEVTTRVVGEPEVNLAIDKRGPLTVEPGKSIEYTIYLSETTGNRAAQNVVLTDSLPPGLTYQSIRIESQHGGWSSLPSQALVTVTGQLVTVDLGTVPPLYHDQIRLFALAQTSLGDVTNNVVIETTTPETRLDDNADSHTLAVRSTPTDSIGDRVFLDRNGDGYRNPTNEPGIGAVKLDLYRFGGRWSPWACALAARSSYVRSTTTDASGSYVFEQAVPPTSTTGLGGDLVVLPAQNFAPGAALAGLRLSPMIRDGESNAAVVAQPSASGACAPYITASDAPAWYASHWAGLPAGTIFVPRLTRQPYADAYYLASTALQRYMADFGLHERWNIAVTKDAPASALAGSVFSYTLGVSNSRGLEQTSVVVSDTLPADLRFLSADPPPSRITGQRLEWDLVLPAASQQQIQLQVTTAPTLAGRLIDNNVCALVAAGEYDVNDNCATDSTQLVPRADLIVAKQGPETVTAGDLLTYTLIYSNAGPDIARAIVLTDTLPAGLLFAGASLPPLIGNQQLSWELGDLAAGASAVITLTVEAGADLPDGATRVNLLEGTTATTETTTANNRAEASTRIRTADLSVTKQGPLTATSGTSWDYRLTYANHGAVTARAVLLTDLLPAGLQVLATSPGAEIIGSQVSWALGDLQPGASGSLSLTVYSDARAASGTILTNTVTIASATPDADPTNNRASVATTLVAVWDLPVGKTVATLRADGKLTPGSSISYTLKVANPGPSSSPTVVLTDHFPAAQLILLEAVPAPAMVLDEGQTLVWQLEALNAGEQAEIVVAARVRDDLQVADGTLVFNRVRSNGPAGGRNDPPPGPGVACTRPRCVQNPLYRVDLSVAKDDGQLAVTPGAELTYQVVAANLGQVAAGGVVLLEQIPPGTQIVAGASPGWQTTAEPQVYRYELGDLDAGASRDIALTVRLNLPYSGTGSVVNRVRIDDDGRHGPDRDPHNNQADDSDEIVSACLGDRVWFDQDGNGLQDSAEPGIGAVLLELLDDAGRVLARTRTDNTGAYRFCDLGLARDYRVLVAGHNFAAGGALEKRTITLRDAGDDTRDSDLAPVARTTGTVRIAEPAGDLTIDIGVVLAAETTDLPIPLDSAQPPPSPIFLPLITR